jgi:hypothetical protein
VLGLIRLMFMKDRMNRNTPGSVSSSPAAKLETPKLGEKASWQYGDTERSRHLLSGRHREASPRRDMRLKLLYKCGCANS